MGDTVVLTVYFPLIIGGMVLLIMWGMSAAGSSRTERNHGKRKRIHSSKV